MWVYWLTLGLISVLFYFLNRKFFIKEISIRISTATFIIGMVFPLLRTNLPPLQVFTCIGLLLIFLGVTFSRNHSDWDGNETVEAESATQPQGIPIISDASETVSVLDGLKEQDSLSNTENLLELNLEEETIDQQLEEKDNNLKTIVEELPSNIGEQDTELTFIEDPTMVPENEEPWHIDSELVIAKLDDEPNKESEIPDKILDNLEDIPPSKFDLSKTIENKMAEDEILDLLPEYPVDNLTYSEEIQEENPTIYVADLAEDEEPTEINEPSEQLDELETGNKQEADYLPVLLGSELTTDSKENQLKDHTECTLPEPDKLSSQDILTEGLRLANSKQYVPAVKQLNKVIACAPEPEILYIVISELSSIYQHLGLYPMASDIVAAFTEHPSLKKHPGMDNLKQKMKFIICLTELLDKYHYGQIPYNQVPASVRREAFENSLNIKELIS